MDSPFPGMDPYLEVHWRSVHQLLITYVLLDLQAIVTQCYGNGWYDDMHYGRTLKPPLPPEDAVWTEELLRSRAADGKSF